MTSVSKEDLLKARFGVESFDIEGVGTVKFRQLSRTEALTFRGKELPIEEMERLLLSTALLEPKLTAEDVHAWQDASPAGEIEPLMRAIMERSGMVKGADKAAVKSPDS